MNTDDYEQPVGERPELDLSFTHRDGRHVPVKIAGPTPAEVEEWRRRQAELLNLGAPVWQIEQPIRPRTRDVVLLVLSLVAFVATLALVVGRSVGVL